MTIRTIRLITAWVNMTFSCLGSTHKTVFAISASSIVIFVLYTLTFPQQAAEQFGALLEPAAVFMVWMTVFGNCAMDQYLIDGYTDVVNTVKNWQPE